MATKTMSIPDFEIYRASLEQAGAAYAIVCDYYEAAKVVARDSIAEFTHHYFGDRAGFWLAARGGQAIGCIALRPLAAMASSGEVKRLYVRPAERRQGIAEGLLQALESHAASVGYRWLYLDTTDEMTAAVHFYELQGYQRCPRYNDNPQATIFMRKELRARMGSSVRSSAGSP